MQGVHLQCHIGTDTVGLSRLGAQMTGLDFSPAAIEQARAFVARSGDDVRFVESDIYDSVSVLGGEQFDLVFTGIGSLCWLPSNSRWAATVAAWLKPGGRLFIREGHPMLWSVAEARPDALLVVDFPYFERDEPIVWEDERRGRGRLKPNSPPMCRGIGFALSFDSGSNALSSENIFNICVTWLPSGHVFVAAPIACAKDRERYTYQNEPEQHRDPPVVSCTAQQPHEAGDPRLEPSLSGAGGPDRGNG